MRGSIRDSGKWNESLQYVGTMVNTILCQTHLLSVELLLELVYLVCLLPDQSRVLPGLGRELLYQSAALQTVRPVLD